MRVVLIDPPMSGPGRREYPSKLPWYVDSIRQSQVGMDAEAMRAFCATWTDEQLQLRAEWLHTCYEPAIVRAFNDFHTVDFHQDLPHLGAPALLIVAGRGGVIQAEDVAEVLERPLDRHDRVPAEREHQPVDLGLLADRAEEHPEEPHLMRRVDVRPRNPNYLGGHRAQSST